MFENCRKKWKYSVTILKKSKKLYEPLHELFPYKLVTARNPPPWMTEKKHGGIEQISEPHTQRRTSPEGVADARAPHAPHLLGDRPPAAAVLWAVHKPS